VVITQATEIYTYRSYFEALLAYDSDAAASHLTNTFWYLDNGDLLHCEPTAANAKTNVSSRDGTESRGAKKFNSAPRSTETFVTYRYIQSRAFECRLNSQRPSRASTWWERMQNQRGVSSSSTAKYWSTASNPVRRSCWHTKSFSHAKIWQESNWILSIYNAVLGPIPKWLLLPMVKKRLSRLREYEPVIFPSVKSDLFRAEPKREKIPTEGLNGSREDFSYGIQNALWSVGNSPPELGSPDNSRNLYKRLFHVTLQLDTWPRFLWGTYITPG